MPGDALSTLDALSHLIVPLLLGAGTIIAVSTKRKRGREKLSKLLRSNSW